MHINPNQVITDLYGNEMKENGEPMTLGQVAIAALLRPDRDLRTGQPKDVPIDVQSKRFQLAVKLVNASTAGLPCRIEDFESVILKDLIASMGMTLLTGRFLEALNGDATQKPAAEPVAAAGATLN